MVTLKDIANLTGVSINTVSRALKDMPDIGAATKRRVRETANLLGYTPNIVARSLALKRSDTIGLIASELENPVRNLLVNSLRHIAAENGIMMLVSGFDDSQEIASQIRRMCARGVDGLLIGNVAGILSESVYWTALEAAQTSGVPVAAFYHAETKQIDNVRVDYEQITEEMTRHLLEKHGFRRIIFASMSLEYERGFGYLRAMRSFGAMEQTGFLKIASYDVESGYQGVLAYLKENPPPEAIVCHNDNCALGILSGLRESGLRVPEDVAVTGIDDIEVAKHFSPSLTTADVCLPEVARSLFDLLSSRIRGDYSGPARQIKIPAKSCFRHSCGCQ